MTLTLGMVTFNDSKNLRDTLIQLDSIVCEIIIIDRDSTDDTILIAQQFGAKVYSVDNSTDLAYCKNLAIDRTTSRYILFMDAGELLIDPSILKTDDFHEDTYTVMCQQCGSSEVFNYSYCNIRLIKTASLMRYETDTHGHAVVRDTYSKLLNVCIICKPVQT